MSERDVHEENATRDIDRNPTERGKWISAAIALLGLWLVVEVFLFDVLAGNFWNDLIVGAILIAVGGYNYYQRADEEVGSFGAAVFVALIGLWLIVSPWVYGIDTGTAEVTTEVGFWNDIIVGLLALVLGGYSAYEAREMSAGTAVER